MPGVLPILLTILLTTLLTTLPGVLPLSACAQQSLVFRGDVLLDIEGQKVADDGTFAVGQQERRCLQRPHPHLSP